MTSRTKSGALDALFIDTTLLSLLLPRIYDMFRYLPSIKKHLEHEMDNQEEEEEEEEEEEDDIIEENNRNNDNHPEIPVYNDEESNGRSIVLALLTGISIIFSTRNGILRTPGMRAMGISYQNTTTTSNHNNNNTQTSISNSKSKVVAYASLLTLTPILRYVLHLAYRTTQRNSKLPEIRSSPILRRANARRRLVLAYTLNLFSHIIPTLRLFYYLRFLFSTPIRHGTSNLDDMGRSINSNSYFNSNSHNNGTSTTTTAFRVPDFLPQILGYATQIDQFPHNHNNNNSNSNNLSINFNYAHRRLLLDELMLSTAPLLPIKDLLFSILISMKHYTTMFNYRLRQRIRQVRHKTHNLIRRGTRFATKRITSKHSLHRTLERSLPQSQQQQQDLICPECSSNAIQIPYIASCGHVYCYACLRKAIHQDPNYRCNVCGEVIQSSHRLTSFDVPKQ